MLWGQVWSETIRNYSCMSQRKTSPYGSTFGWGAKYFSGKGMNNGTMTRNTMGNTMDIWRIFMDLDLFQKAWRGSEMLLFLRCKPKDPISCHWCKDKAPKFKSCEKRCCFRREFLQASLQYLDLSLDPQATKGVVGHGYPPDLYNVGKMVYIWMPYTIYTFENGGKNPYMDHVP